MLPTRVFFTTSQCSFKLVHRGVISGPACIQSTSGCGYYIVFIDDYSCVFWVYLLKDRMYVLDVVKKFFVEIINQFSTSPKVFHTDNALEFVQRNLQNYCASLGILHQTFCAYTTQ